MLRRLNILLLCIVAFTTFASAQNAEKALQEFEGKTLILRHPQQSNAQQYDAKGNPLGSEPEGPWTVYGGVLIDKVTLAPDKLSFKGRHILFLSQNGQFGPLEFKPLENAGPPPLSPFMTVEIKLDRPLDSAEQARAMLGRIFALNTSELLDLLPDFWRSCLKDRFIYDAARKPGNEFSWRPAPAAPTRVILNNEPPISSEQVGSETIEHVFQLGLGVMSRNYGIVGPTATTRSRGEYPRVASYEQLQGIAVMSVLVDKIGMVRRIRLIEPLGLGLDEDASSSIQASHFLPATRGGEPVAVEVDFQPSFTLQLRKPPTQAGTVAAMENSSSANSTPAPNPNSLATPLPATSGAENPGPASSSPADPKPADPKPVNANLDTPNPAQVKPVVLSAGKLKKLITGQYQKQILALRNLVPEAGDDYDPDGHPLKGIQPDHWALYSGLIYAKKINVKDGDIEVQGTPVILNGFPIGNPMKIRLHLGPQPHTAEEVQQMMGRLFLQDKPSLQRARPVYRRDGATDGPISHVGGNVTGPHATYTPEPEFSEQARKAKYSGTAVLTIVVDKNGNVSRISVARALGMGLDAEAVNRLRTWRFSPAMRGNEPVAVEMNVEVSFNLY
jgi:TonB family protein